MHTILENLGKELEIKKTKKLERKPPGLKCLFDGLLISTFSVLTWAPANPNQPSNNLSFPFHCHCHCLTSGPQLVFTWNSPNDFLTDFSAHGFEGRGRSHK